MQNRNIIVIGASAGGFEAIKLIVAGLPSNLNASVFVVWHMSPDVRGILPQVLSQLNGPEAVSARDREKIKTGKIYVAPPDHHLVLEEGIMRVTRGPKENRFRPAVDPLFRSAAYAYGPRVIGIILSGALDDGTAGLWAVKAFGGVAVVQDPEDAEVPSMPANALQAVAVDYKMPIAGMAALILKLIEDEVPEKPQVSEMDQKRTEIEIDIAMEDVSLKQNVLEFGSLTPYTCPECHGVLASLIEGDRMRFRCHTGHAFSADSLMAAISQSIEETLWSAIRNVRESVMLLNHMGDHFAAVNQPKLAAMYFKKAKEAEHRAKIVRSTVMNHEQLSTEIIKAEIDRTE